MAAHVELRPVRPEDRDRLLAWRNAPEVAAFMYSDHQISPEEHDRWFAGVSADPRRAYWIIVVDGAPTGLANLADIDAAQGRCAWAYYLADPSVRGKGVGSFVEYWMLEEVFTRRALRKLWCEVLVSNEAVWKLHGKFGFQQEARFRAHVVKNGVAQDVLGLGLLAEEWAGVRPGMKARLEKLGFRL
jgi:UDP-4-amino-4,6-dideoxy-N-acetyl-beta-L-altrosamine N-acetyltransferase